jgi:hypothetical protein
LSLVTQSRNAHSASDARIIEYRRVRNLLFIQVPNFDIKLSDVPVTMRE